MFIPSTQFAQVASGLTLEYRRQGPADRTPLVFLHGFTDSCRSFGPLLAALPDDMHAIAVSLRLRGWAWHKILASVAAEDPGDLLPQIDAPTLLVCGEEDALFGVDYQQRLMAALPNAWLEILPGLGHSPHWEDPARVAALIAAFAGFAPASAMGAQE